MPTTSLVPPPVPRWPALDPWADAVNPAMGVVLFGLVVHAALKRRWMGAAGVPLRLLATLAVAYGLAALDRATGAFASVGLDYSTHGAVHLAAWTTVLATRPTWWRAGVAVTAAYAAVMLLQGYHSALDLVATAMATGPVLALVGLATTREGRCTLARHAGRGPHRP